MYIYNDMLQGCEASDFIDPTGDEGEPVDKLCCGVKPVNGFCPDCKEHIEWNDDDEARYNADQELAMFEDHVYQDAADDYTSNQDYGRE